MHPSISFPDVPRPASSSTTSNKPSPPHSTPSSPSTSSLCCRFNATPGHHFISVFSAISPHFCAYVLFGAMTRVERQLRRRRDNRVPSTSLSSWGGKEGRRANESELCNKETALSADKSREGGLLGGGEGSGETEAKKSKQPETCSSEDIKEKSLWRTLWCNVWRHALWRWGSVMVTMVPSSRYVCSAHAQEDESNDREERILAVLGIIGTVLNLLVVIFVYIYTSGLHLGARVASGSSTPEERFLAVLGMIGIFLNLLLLLFV
uniref:Uncharacterized protein n=1 Tax=Knipowitschia caucasica TaxID=637954 RepID=A0AAV2IYG0_KNICA